MMRSGESARVAAFALLGDGGRRGQPLALAPVKGEPLYLWAVRSLRARAGVDSLVVLVPARLQSRVTRELGEAGLSVAVVPVPDSSASGYLRTLAELLRLTPAAVTHVALHDVTIPVVDAECWGRALVGTNERRACVAAQIVHDTIKLTGQDGAVRETPPRSELRSLQPPLVATPRLLMRALAKLAHDMLAPAEAASGWLEELVTQVIGVDGVELLAVPAGANSVPVRSAGDLSLVGGWVAGGSVGEG